MSKQHPECRMSDSRSWAEELTSREQLNLFNAACGDLSAPAAERACVKCGILFSGRRCLSCKKASDAAWKLANIERRKVVDSEWVKNNPDKVRATKRRYAENHPEKRKASKAAWQGSNRERMRIHGQNRRAKIKGDGNILSFGLKDRLFNLQKGRCACCKADLLKKRPHLDHIIPIALGGANSDENMQLLCYACNQSKNAKHPIDFMQSRGYLL